MKKFLEIFILILSIFLFSYTFYKSEIILNGDFRNEYNIYYLLSIVLFCFSIIIFFLNKKIKTYLLISIISIFVTLYFFETYLLLSVSKLNSTKNKIEFFEKLKKKNKDIAVTVYPSGNIYNKNNLLALSGVSNSKTVFCNEYKEYSIYDSDRYGFNNPDKEWEKKNIEYLLIGDSFTHGACVNRPHDISSNLRILSKKGVLNLGYSGNGPLLMYSTLREYIQDGVKNIIWIYYENDISDLKKELKSEILLQYTLNPNFTQNLIKRQNEIDIMLRKNTQYLLDKKKKFNQIKNEEVNKFFKFIKITKLRNLIYNNFFLKTIVNPKNQDDKEFNNLYLQKEFKNILKLAIQISNENNSNFYFVYLPGFDNYLKNKNPDKMSLNEKIKVIKNIVESLGIKFIDIDKEVFKKENDPLNLFPFKQPGHYTEEGYEKVSEAIYNNTK